MIFAVVPGKVCFVCHTDIQAPVEHMMIILGHSDNYYLSTDQKDVEDAPIVSHVEIDETEYRFVIK